MNEWQPLQTFAQVYLTLPRFLTDRFCECFIFTGETQSGGHIFWLYQQITSHRSLNLDREGHPYEQCEGMYIPTTAQAALHHIDS